MAISGTKEWSVKSVNCVNGCSHACRYCYARWDAAERYGRIAPADWETMRVRPHDVRKRHKRYDGRVMFPTTHDITPAVLDDCITVIGNLLEARNELLIVSKPHLGCIQEICRTFLKERSRIMFRFSIGAIDDQVLSYWEPGAPPFAERFQALVSAHAWTFATSVSCEPLLDASDAVKLFRKLEPYVSDSIWFGKMNRIDQRVIDGTSPEAIEAIKRGQTDERIREIYEALKDEPKVRWKESYKAVLGIALATEAGADR